VQQSTYADDRDFLSKHADTLELSAAQGACLAVVPAFQGRVMTSTLAGEAGAAYGWLNRRFIEQRRDDPAFNNYGGEDRFWLGPEGGQFGLWFACGEPFDVGHWKTPRGFGAGAFKVTGRTTCSVTMDVRFEVTNYSGAQFRCAVTRTINALTPGEVSQALGTTLPEGLSTVAFESVNTLANAGQADWTRQGGLVSIWILGQYNPLPHGRVTVPFLPGDEAGLGPKATTDYFGPLPPQRCAVHDAHLLFTCDGQFRSKIGVSPARARDILGSYDADAGVLTLVKFNLPSGAAELPYVNSLWEHQDAPFAGDAVNSYNDGAAEPGAGQLGPFYEIETSSPAAELQAGESITHVHRTCHFAGKFGALNRLSQEVLGVNLKQIDG